MKEKQNHIYAATSIAITVMLSLIAVFMGLSSVNSRADGYTYTKIASRGDTAPGGAQFSFDFEPGQINNMATSIW